MKCILKRKRIFGRDVVNDVTSTRKVLLHVCSYDFNDNMNMKNIFYDFLYAPL